MDRGVDAAVEVGMEGAMQVGPLLAEGGEGRVYELANSSSKVFKAYRRPRLAGPLEALVAWPERLLSEDATAANRLARVAAWPTTVVLDEPRFALLRPPGGPGAVRGQAAGVVLPRAPEQFSLRHRDGSAHLATLSYLSAEPERRSIAYGIELPPACSPERLGLVYALARVLEALQSGHSPASHGDLSNKNVLWSFDRGPEVYLLDCDNSDLHTADGASLLAGRRRPMTPNWEDPAVGAADGPNMASDRYSLALIFLRVFGAAHFPLQERQNRSGRVMIDVEVPRGIRALAGFGRGAQLWEYCSAALSLTSPEQRPSPSAWVDLLRGLLAEMGAGHLAAQVRANQDGPRVQVEVGAGRNQVSYATSAAMSDVSVRPVAVLPRVITVQTVTLEPPVDRGRPRASGFAALPGATAGTATAGAATAGTATARAATAGTATAGKATAVIGPSFAQARINLRRVLSHWLAAHRRMVRMLRSGGRRRAGARKLVFLAVVDIAGACLALFVFGVFLGPFFGL